MPLQTAAWLMRNELGESARVCELAEIVQRQTGRLSRMMEELSDWARLETGDVSLDRAPVESALLVDMALCGIADCQVAPVYHDGSAEVQVSVDQHRADQLLRTLIQYALHRDPDRVPTLEVSVQSSQLVICVRHQGPPHAADARDVLLSNPQSSPFDEGLGLRLIIARKIAEAHGGQLTVDDRCVDGESLVCSLPALVRDSVTV